MVPQESAPISLLPMCLLASASTFLVEHKITGAKDSCRLHSSLISALLTFVELGGSIPFNNIHARSHWPRCILYEAPVGYFGLQKVVRRISSPLGRHMK